MKNYWNIVKTKDLGIATYETTWMLKISSVRLSNIKITAGKLDTEKLKRAEVIFDSENNWRIKTEGEQAFALQLSYDYEYVSYLGGRGTGEAVINDYNTVISKIFDANGRVHSEVRVSFSLVTLAKLTTGSYVGSEYVADLAKKALLDLITQQQELLFINEIFMQQLDIYWAISSKLIVKLGKPFQEIVNYNFAYKYTPKILRDNKGVIFYHDGGIEIEGSKALTTSKAEVDRDTWDDFNINDGELQIFLSEDIFNDLFSTLQSNNKLNIIFSQFSGTNFNVALVSKFYPGKSQ